MSEKRKNWLAIAVMFAGLFLLSFVGTFYAQQQFSGGQTVTVGNASLPVTESGTWTVQPGNTPNTSPWLATINQGGNSATVTASNALKVDGSAVTQPASLASLPALVASTAKIGVTYPYTGCGTTQAESGTPAGFAALAASTTTVFSSTTCLLTFIITNTGSASFTYYVTDNAGTPIAAVGSSGNPITILPGERDEYTFQNGAKLNAGVKLTASATTGAFYMLGIQ